MWIVDLFYIVVALTLGSALMWGQSLTPLLFPFLGLLILAGDRWLGRHIPRWVIPSLLIPWAALMVWWLTDAAPGGVRYPLLLMMVAVMMVISLGTRGRYQAAQFAGAPVAVAILWLLLSGYDPEGRLQAGRLAIWGMVLWPFLVFIGNPRKMLLVLWLGPLAILAMVRLVIDAAAASPGTVHAILASVPELAMREQTVAAQLLLLLLVAFPLVLGAGFRWLLLSLCAIGLIAISLFMAWANYGSGGLWPMEATVTIFIATVILAIGLAGILGSARRVGLLPALAAKTLALGSMASAVTMSLLLDRPPASGDLVIYTAQALAPAVVGSILAILVGCAALIPAGEEVRRLRTAHILNAWADWRRSVITASVSLGRDLVHGFTADGRLLRDPWRLLPLLICVAAWPAAFALQEGIWIVLPFVIAFFLNGLARHHVTLWLAVHASLVAVAALGLGHTWQMLPLFMSLGLMVAWPFCRWPHLDHAFAYPATVVLLAPIWLVTASVDATQVVFGMGLMVLIANALRRGPLRWLLLAIAFAAISLWLAQWIVERDPFTTIILEGRSIGDELLHILAVLPFMAVLLLLLWVTRLRGAEWWMSLSGRDLMLLVAVIAVAVSWALGVRQPWLLAGVGSLLLVAMQGMFSRGLCYAPPAAYRHPLTAALAVSLMLSLVAVAHAIPHVDAPSGTGVSDTRVHAAGVLGPVYVQTVRDIGSTLLALIAIIVWHLCIRHGHTMVVGVTQTFVRPRTAAALPGLPRKLPLLQRVGRQARQIIVRLGIPLEQKLRQLWAGLCSLKRFIPHGSDTRSQRSND